MLLTFGILAAGSAVFAIRRLLVLHGVIHGGRLSTIITGLIFVIPAIIALCASMKHHGRR